MVHVNIPKVRGKMAEKGYSITSLANMLKISRGTLASYLSTPEKMPYNVVANLADILCDTEEEATSIFFSHDCAMRKEIHA